MFLINNFRTYLMLWFLTCEIPSSSVISTCIQIAHLTTKPQCLPLSITHLFSPSFYINLLNSMTTPFISLPQNRTLNFKSTHLQLQFLVDTPQKKKNIESPALYTLRILLFMHQASIPALTHASCVTLD